MQSTCQIALIALLTVTMAAGVSQGATSEREATPHDVSQLDPDDFQMFLEVDY